MGGRILNFLLGLVFVPFGLAIGAAGSLRFFRGAAALAERRMESDEAAPYLASMLLGLALVAVAYWAVIAGWKRLKGALGRAAAAGEPAAAAPPAKPGPGAAAPVPPPLPAILTLTHAGQTALLTASSGEATLGRGADCRIVVASKHVSRAHAKVLWDATGAPRIVNLGQMGTSVGSTGLTGYRLCDPELPLDGEGTIALSSNGPDAAARGDVIAFEVSRG